ncbi:MAG: sensor histidine kinase [Prevotella sp.]|nr:sensor histidine kinase [Prevotella sp.]
MLMVAFYANYLWLTPHYYVKGEKRYFWLVNIILCVGLGVGAHLWFNFIHRDDADRVEPTLWLSLFFILRNIFNLAISAGIGATIQLALRWTKAEEARLEAEAAHTDAELRNLRNQINPHFLLNTLNNIYALTAIDSEKAQDAIQQLSKLLRHMLYENQQSEVLLSDEVQFLENYINLMKIRLSQMVEITFSTEGLTGNHKVAPLIFISLVENAFKHGVSPTEPSFIHISLVADRQHIVCDIENSNHPKTSQDRSGHGIGLQQVQRRLDLAYPGRYVWQKGVSADGLTYHSTLEIKQP